MVSELYLPVSRHSHKIYLPAVKVYIKEDESSTAFCFKLCSKQGNTVSDYYSTQLKGWEEKKTRNKDGFSRFSIFRAMPRYSDFM
jgi:hypothetical protein